VALADPKANRGGRSLWRGLSERVGLPEGSTPSPRRPSYLAVPRKATAVLGFFDGHPKLFSCAQQQAVPSHCANAMRRPRPSVNGPGLPLPHAYSEHWVAQTYLPAPLARAKCFLAARSLAGKGHRGQAAATTGAPAHWPQKPKAMRRARSRSVRKQRGRTP